METGVITREIGEAISRAADEFITGRHYDQFKLDVFQAGAGTSYNMNVNEAIANRALELLGSRRGDYSRLHPNDHVNKSQSTNDAMLTAMRVACLSCSANSFPRWINSRVCLVKKPTSSGT